MSLLEESRREAEARMADLRAALSRELGLAAPRGAGWWLLVAAGAIGLTVAVGWAAARRRSRR